MKLNSEALKPGLPGTAPTAIPAGAPQSHSPSSDTDSKFEVQGSRFEVQRSLPPSPSSSAPSPGTEAPESKIENHKSKCQNPPRSRRNGKIARLPKKLRDSINELLADGVTYAQIVQHLNQSTDPPLPYAISERNISNWHTGGYQDWLRHQEHLELLAGKIDFALDLARNSQPDKLQELSLQLATIRMCEFLSELALADPQSDPNMYLRLLSVLPRISKETLNLQKYRDAFLKAQPATPAQPLSEADCREAARTALLDQFDDIMGLKSYRHKVEQASSPAASLGVPYAPAPALVLALAPNPASPPACPAVAPQPSSVEQASSPAGSAGVSPPTHPELQPQAAAPLCASPNSSDLSDSSDSSDPDASKVPDSGGPSGSDLEVSPGNAPSSPQPSPPTETSGNLRKPNSSSASGPQPASESEELPNTRFEVRLASTQLDGSGAPSSPPELAPPACALCGNRPISFVHPLPHECQLCSMRPPIPQCHRPDP